MPVEACFLIYRMNQKHVMYINRKLPKNNERNIMNSLPMSKISFKWFEFKWCIGDIEITTP